jgi:hypothetical protein
MATSSSYGECVSAMTDPRLAASTEGTGPKLVRTVLAPRLRKSALALRIESLREQREMLTLGQSPLAGAQFASWLARPVVSHDQHRAGESPRV